MMLPLLAAIAPVASLVGGAVAALGSLFAPKPEPTVQTNSIDLAKLRADAEASGFNPLTIIRGGGLSGYSRSEMSAAPDMRLSNAFQTFGTAVANWQYDPYGAQRSRTELRLMEAQIADFARRGAAPSGMSFSTPKASVSGPQVSDWKNQDVRLGGVTIHSSKSKWSPASVIQDEYGELWEWLYSIPKGLADAWDDEVFLGARPVKPGENLQDALKVGPAIKGWR